VQGTDAAPCWVLGAPLQGLLQFDSANRRCATITRLLSSNVLLPRSPLRIGLFAPYDLARAGGVGNQVRAQARALRQLGHDVRVYGPASAPLGTGETAISGAVTVTFGGTESGIGLDPRGAFRVARLFASRTFDIVHVHEPLVPAVPWFVLRQARAPIVATFHVHRETGHRWYPLAQRWLRSLMNRVHCRIAVSEPARRTIARHFPGTYQIVPNGIDVDAFRVSRPRPAEFVAGRLHVVYIGRLEHRKGVDRLIHAMARVQQSVPEARAVIVGDGPERRRLLDTARLLGVDAEFTGRVDDADLPGYVQAADVVCSPALGGESFGIVLLEAMACEKPIVASRIEGYEILVGRARCGALVAPGDKEALAGSLVTLLRDRSLRQALGAHGLEAARQYDWSLIAQVLEGIYCRLVQARRSDRMTRRATQR
jgi:phosphatidyl-myo-inositol alpha-mannosyltransferase